jgi:hypothetical protein
LSGNDQGTHFLKTGGAGRETVSKQAASLWLTFPLRVNGVAFHEAALRASGAHPTNIQVVIRDRQLGVFALHEEFVLEIREQEWEGAPWRQVSIGELTVAVSQAAERVACDAHAGRGVVEESLEARNAAVSENLERIPVEGDSSHVGRAGEALTRARIRFQIVGGLDSRGRSACHLTLVVPTLLGAGTCLRRAGFLESLESKYVLVDSRTGWKLRLLQGRPTRSCAR